MNIVCPNCRECVLLDLHKLNIVNPVTSLIEIQDSLKGELDQIDNVINIIDKDPVNSKNQIKNIKENIIFQINKLIENIKEIYKAYEDIKKNNIPKDNIELHNIKGEQGWDIFVANALFNTQNENGDIFNNILVKAALVGENGLFWSYSSNFHLDPFEFEKIKNIFNLKTEKENDFPKKLNFERKTYDIINHKQGTFLDIKNGDIGGTIAKSKKSYIFGFFNSNVNFRLNGKEDKQNLELCHKVVTELVEKLISMNY